MLWLTWRQHRWQVLVTVGLLGLLGVALLVHAWSVTGFAAANQPAGCPGAGAGAACAEFEIELRRRFSSFYNLVSLVLYAPVAIGVFWGVPVLTREYERGTHVLAWTQSVSWRRWLLVKITTLAALVLACGLALGAMFSAWLAVFDGYGLDWQRTAFSDPSMFTLTGLAPAGWWLFGFGVGLVAGALVRRTLLAIGITAAGMFALLIAMFVVDLRTYYAPVQRAETPVHAEVTQVDDGAMIRDRRYLAPDGREVSGADLIDECAGVTVRDCPPAGYRNVVYYQPVERYWRFQGTEVAILLVASAGLGGLTVRSVRRRRL